MGGLCLVDSLGYGDANSRAEEEMEKSAECDGGGLRGEAGG